MDLTSETKTDYRTPKLEIEFLFSSGQVWVLQNHFLVGAAQVGEPLFFTRKTLGLVALTWKAMMGIQPVQQVSCPKQPGWWYTYPSQKYENQLG